MAELILGLIVGFIIGCFTVIYFIARFLAIQYREGAFEKEAKGNVVVYRASGLYIPLAKAIKLGEW